MSVLRLHLSDLLIGIAALAELILLCLSNEERDSLAVATFCRWFENTLDSSVKAGRNVFSDIVRALRGTVDREATDLGMFVCLDPPPTREMRAEATAAGLIDLPGGQQRQRIKIVTAKDLVAGPNLGIVTGLDILQASDAVRLANRQPRQPRPEDLRREPELPP